MNSSTPSPLPAESVPPPVRAFRSHEKPDELRFNFAGHPFSAELLKSDRSFVLEIGCGVGWHPIQLAQQLGACGDRKTLIVAIERTKNKFDSFCQRLQHHPEFQQSICAVQGDAFHFVDHHFPPASLDEVWMLYPNPEIKRQGLRWYNAPAFQRLSAAMKPGAHFHFATNLHDYSAASIARAETLGFLVLSHTEVSKKTNPSFQPRSHFEKKYFERGEVLFSTLFQKKISS